MQRSGNPNGYCGLGGTGVRCPIGTGVTRRADEAYGSASTAAATPPRAGRSA